MGATLDPVHVGSGKKVEQVRRQAREQSRCGALTARSAGWVQPWGELGTGCMFIEQLDVGELGSTVLESGSNGPIDGLAQRDCGREIFVSDLDAGIQQTRLNRPVGQQ